MPGTRPTGPTGTRPGSDDATVMERNLTASPKTSAKDEATVMERLDAPGAAPTAIEAKYNAGAQAEATVLESKYSPAPSKSKLPLFAAAAAIVLVIAALAFFMARKAAEKTASGPAAIPSTASTETTVTSTPIAPGQGVLLLSASPWGEIDRIVSKGDQKEVPLEDDLSTPARIPLDPGDYTVTLSGESGTQTIDVRIDAGKPTQRNVRMRDLNFDELTQEVTKP